MQTLHYTTNNEIRRSGNVIDLCAYRERIQPAPAREEVGEEPRPDRRRSHPRQSAFALLMDSIASMGVILMTLTFTFWVVAAL